MGNNEDTWQLIYRNLLRLLRLKQSEAETLAGERQRLKNHILSLHDRWRSDVDQLQDYIAKMRAEVEMDRMLYGAKMELVVASERRETAVYKKKSDRDSSDLEDLQLLVEYFISKESERKSNNVDRDEMRDRNLHEEIKKLVWMNENVTVEKDALLRERNFAWNQFKKMESDYSKLLKAKRSELQHANQELANLQQVADKSNLLVKEKDMTIVSLKTKIAKDEKNLNDCSRKISKLSKELELLRTAGNASSMQLVKCSLGKSIRVGKKQDDTGRSLRRSSRISSGKCLSMPAEKCSKAESSRGGTKDGEVGQSSGKLKKASQASSGAKNIEGGSRKRTRSESRNFEPIWLMSSDFKVPKLKKSSPHG